MQADKYKVPRICFVNKMDRMGADFFNTVKMIVSNLAATPAVTQVRLREATQLHSGCMQYCLQLLCLEH